MMLVIIGAGSFILGLIWCFQSGLHSANTKPAVIGLLVLMTGLFIPLGDAGTTMSPDAPPIHEPPPPGMEAPGSHHSPPQMHQAHVQNLSLSVGPTISTRLRFACTTDPKGIASCWGEPVPLPDGPIHKIALGREHGCALMQTGALNCWGEAQLEASRLNAHRFVDIAATLETICGITNQGALHCFGADLGMPPPGQRWTQLSGGANHMCALTSEGAPACWGSNDQGQTDAPDGTRLTSISAGHFHTCGIDTSDFIVCWGRNDEHQSTPPETHGFTQVSAGWAHSCAVDNAGKALCWGCNAQHADLMTGSEEACTPPSTPFSAISAGDLWRSCGVTPSGEVSCWGGLKRIGGPS